MRSPLGIMREGSCGAEVEQLPEESYGGGGLIDQVIMASYPNTGSTWLNKLLTASAGDICASPSCSIYEREGECEVSDGAYCPCSMGSQPSLDALLKKTHFPAQELFRGRTLVDEQYNKSMRFDRVILLARHPVATVNSNVYRSGGTRYMMARNLECWSRWWDRVRASVDEESWKVIRYEDLCLNTAETVHQVLQFIGGCYHRISREDVQSAIDAEPELQCLHAHDFESVPGVEDNEDKLTMELMRDFFLQWGYSNVSEWNLLANSRHTDSLNAPAPDSEINPWLSIW